MNEVQEQQVYMKAADVLFASAARCYIEVEGKRYNFMNMLNVEVTFKKNKVPVAILGKTGFVASIIFTPFVLTSSIISFDLSVNPQLLFTSSNFSI